MTNYLPIKKVFEHIIFNEDKFKVIQYQEGYFCKIYILTDGIVHIKKSEYNNFDEDIYIKPEYVFGYGKIIYNPKYIKKINKNVRNIIEKKIKFYDTFKHNFNGWKGD